MDYNIDNLSKAEKMKLTDEQLAHFRKNGF